MRGGSFTRTAARTFVLVALLAAAILSFLRFRKKPEPPKRDPEPKKDEWDL